MRLRFRRSETSARSERQPGLMTNTRGVQKQEPDSFCSRQLWHGTPLDRAKIGYSRLVVLALAFLILTSSRVLSGTNGLWTRSTTGGNWSAANNWLQSIVADGI